MTEGWPKGNQLIDRESDLPYYEQIKRALIAAATDGHICPGELLPGEHELCRIFGVSRTAVRQALGALEYEGFVTRVKGKGTFLADRKTRERLANRLMGLYEDVSGRGGTVTSRVLQQEFLPADVRVAEKLGVEPDDDVLVLERLRYVDGVPWSLSKTWLPGHIGELVKDSDFNSASLYLTLEQHGVQAVRGRRILEAIVTDAREGELLGIGEGVPAMRLNSITRAADGRAIECFVAVHRGDKSSFVFDIGDEAEGGLGLRLQTS